MTTPTAADIERTLWWRDPIGELCWVERDDFCAVFDPASGETHLLNPLPALLLQHIGHEPRSVPQLLADIANGDEFAVDSVAAQKAFVALQSLRLAELIDAQGPV